jgi:SAM-dependent methyltransferase
LPKLLQYVISGEPSDVPGPPSKVEPMPLDVVDLRSFYGSRLGKVAGRFIGRVIRVRFANSVGLSLMGVGYATPYLSSFREEALRVLAFMPAAQGVVNWPSSGRSASALVEPRLMPLPDGCIDRVIVVHALEIAEHPHELLAEIWRILTPGGRMIVVVPRRAGLWARLDTTPFGHGRPYSRSQMREFMRETLFSPTHWTEALYVPPFERHMFLRSAALFEKVGASLSLPGAGVLIVEATKQLYRPVGLSRSARQGLPQLQPVLGPRPAGIAHRVFTPAS